MSRSVQAVSEPQPEQTNWNAKVELGNTADWLEQMAATLGNTADWVAGGLTPQCCRLMAAKMRGRAVLLRTVAQHGD